MVSSHRVVLGVWLIAAAELPDSRDRLASGLRLPPNTRLRACKHGIFAFPENDAVIGASLERYGEWSEGELSTMLALIRPGDLVVDVGGNIGAFTVPIARAVTAAAGDGIVRGRVFTFEPEPNLYALLALNLGLAGLDGVVSAYRVALGASRGSTRFTHDAEFSTSTNWGASALVEGVEGVGDAAVTVLPLDEVLASDDCPALIKVDVEGWETAVLRGANRTLSPHIGRCSDARAVLYVENNCIRGSADLLTLLRALEYNVWWDVRPYFSGPSNFRNYQGRETLFGDDGVLAINVLAVPRERTAQVNSEREISVEGFVQLSLGYDDEAFPAFLPYLHQYDLLWRNATTRLRQHGDLSACIR